MGERICARRRVRRADVPVGLPGHRPVPPPEKGRPWRRPEVQVRLRRVDPERLQGAKPPQPDAQPGQDGT
eukprot:5043305-Heterocapsa_arctica.AAC.1